MPRPQEEDLFSESTMTFGEHLAELQKCLWRAVVGLMIGFAIGLYFGTTVVNWIQIPLSNALTQYYQKEAEDKLHRAAAETAGAEQLEKLDRQAKERLYERQMLAEEVYLDPAEVVKQLKTAYPQELKSLPELKSSAKPGSPDNLLRVFLWHRKADDQRVRIKSMSAQETFAIYIKASLLVGVLIASPWILYQLWLFISAGLYPNEKKMIHVYLPISVGLFFLGATIAFAFVFKPVLNFLFSYNQGMGIDPDPRISEWLSFVMILPVGFGAGFQLPLVMFFLERVGIFTAESYLRQWKLFVFAIVVIAAVLTPPDPYSMSFLAGPLVILFFGGILLCKWMPKKKSAFESLDR
ncbi:MAG: twin-arginine translocase subunit TatC [Pirellulales bacterium]|nr:twin-arginine translocase subunit TatC [Pirellulales bacterium]